MFLCVLTSLRSELFLIWPFGTVSSRKFEPVTYSWSPAEETRKLKGHSAVSPNALCYKHSGSRLGRLPELRNHQRLARSDVRAGAPAQITRDRDIYRIRNPVLFQLVITVPWVFIVPRT